MRKLWNRLRITLLVTIALLTALIVSGIVYLSQVGLNQDARDRISFELERYGFYVSFEDLTYDFTNGLTAKQVNLYTTAERNDPLATLPHLVIDVDRTKFIRGKLKVNKVALQDADLHLPIDYTKPDGLKVEISNFSGEFYFPSKHSLETSNLQATWQGIDISIQGHVWKGPDIKKDPDKPEEEWNLEADYKKVLQHLAQWDWQSEAPPKLQLNLEGAFNDPATFRTGFQVQIPEIQHKGFRLSDVALAGDFQHGALTLDKIQLSDNIGKLTGKGDYLPNAGDGRFEIQSSIDFQRAYRTFTQKQLLSKLQITGQHTIIAKGDFQQPKKDIEGKEDIEGRLHLMGTLVGKDFRYLGKRFDSLNTAFSYTNNDLFLDNLTVTIGEKALQGKLLYQANIIRYKVNSDLPIFTYQPFLEGTPIMRTLERCSFDEDRSAVTLTLEGTMNRSDVTDWSTKGHLDVTNFAFNGVPLNRLKSEITLNSLLSKYQNIEATFDYSDYTLRKKHKGPSSGTAKIKEIEFDRTDKNVSIHSITGKFWPAPFVALFQKSIADHIEQYKFTRPPTISASGNVALRHSSRTTGLSVEVSSPDTVYYHFLKRDVALTNLNTKIKISKRHVHLPTLSFRAFDGPISGNLKVGLGDQSYSGFLKWTEIPLNSLNRTYQFSEKKNKGTLIGNLYFSGKSNQLSSFNAKSGTISLKRGTLFDVPVLGPLSPLIGQTLGRIIGNKRVLHERAKDASCSFIIRNGVIYTNDFTSHTTSMNFTGHGSIDLNRETIDVTAQMNIRGLIGFIALPLRPFTDTLFQYRGTGKISDASWAPAPFKAPPKDHPLFRKPPKATIVR